MVRWRAGAVLASALCFLLLPASALAHVGTGIVVDADGRIFFSDPQRNVIWRLNPDGQLTRLGSDIHADGLVLLPDGSLYVFGLKTWRITPTGHVFEYRGELSPQFRAPMTVDRQGNFYFLQQDCRAKRESQIWKAEAAGEVRLLAGSTWGQADGKGSEAHFTCLNAWAWGPDGSLYVRGGETIRRVGPDGTATTVPGSHLAAAAEDGDLALVRTMGLAVDALGNVYVANYWKRAVLKVTPEGKISTVLESGWPWVPAGVAVVGEELYVVENLGNFYGPSSILSAASWIGLHTRRLRKLATDGTVTTLVRVGRQ